MKDISDPSVRHATGPVLGRMDGPRRHRRLTALRDAIASWRRRTRFRWELKRMAKDNPHLIDDIGLTKRQVEEEIARLPFWQR